MYYIKAQDHFTSYRKSKKPTVSEKATNFFIAWILEKLESLIGTLYVKSEEKSLSVPALWNEKFKKLAKFHVLEDPAVLFDVLFSEEGKNLYYTRLGSRSVGEKKYREASFLHWGASLDFDIAIAKTVGEFLERYSLRTCISEEYLNASLAELEKQNKNFLNPQLLSYFTDVQKKNHEELNFANDSKFKWVLGKSYLDNMPYLLPAQSVFWDYNTYIASEPILRDSNSNGAAGMFSFQDALLRGLRELIQRDAFLIFWLNTIAPPRIYPDSIPDSTIQTLLAAAKKHHVDIHILDITSDFELPTFVVIASGGDRDKKGFFVGAGCEASPEEAIKGALIEALVLHTVMQESKKTFVLPEPYTSFMDWNIRQQERLLLWSNKNMLIKAEWFFRGQASTLDDRRMHYRAPKGIKYELKFLAEKCRVYGPNYGIYYYAPEKDFLKEVGYTVVKVIVPALINLYLREPLAPLNATRLYEVPKTLGYHVVNFPNLLPHPFA